MPNYKKKKHSKLFSSQGKPKKSNTVKAENFFEDFTAMAKDTNKKSENEKGIKVLKGKKLARKRRFKITAIACAVLLSAIIVLQTILPAGIVETLTNSVALLGSGNYPINLESADTVNVISKNSYYYVLTDSYVKAFTNSGKNLFSYAHGMENPIIKVSSSRALVFNQGSTEGLIFNLNGLKSTITAKTEIITGAISDSGIFALATHSDKYSSAVTVYNKAQETLYEWYSAKETVNNVALSPNGKKLAVSSFSSDVGEYKSTLNVLNFKSATPEYTESFEETLIYNIDTSSRSCFTVVTPNKIKFIKWSKFKTAEYTNDYTISFFKAYHNSSIAVFNRENNKNDNRIVVFGRNGKKLYEFAYNNIISDINLFDKHIYTMSETEIYSLDTNGKPLKKASCGFGVAFFKVNSVNNISVITDNKIEKIKLEEPS